MSVPTALTRDDLRGFHHDKRDLVMEFIDAGWAGRMTAGGHALLMAPDGDTTTMVSRNHGGARIANTRAHLRRWLKDQQATDPLDEESGEPTGGEHPAMKVYVCPDCPERFDTPQKLGGHRMGKHTVHACPDCPETFTATPSLAAHRRNVHGYVSPVRARKEAEDAVLEAAKAVVRDAADTVEPIPAAVADDVVFQHAMNLPEGEDAERLIAQVRAIIAAPLVTEIDRLRRERDQLRADKELLVKQNGEMSARLDLIAQAYQA